jgi:hypothetical protein
MKSSRYFLLFNLFLLILILLVSSVSGAQPLMDQPFVIGSSLRTGESLEYNVRIKGIPAGTQVMQVSEMRIMNGNEVYHVESSSKPNSVFSVFYTFNDFSQSFINSKDYSPIRYERKIIDGRYRGNIAVEFDSIKHIARVEKDKKYTEVRVPEGVQDELSMIYLLRSREIEVGEDYEFSALVGTKSTKIGVSVLRTEKIKTVLGTLKTIVVKTIPRDITVWFTDDSTRIPVRIEASTKIGKLVASLKSMR